MIYADDLLNHIQEEQNGIDMISRFAGGDGWPPAATVPVLNSKDSMTSALGEEIAKTLDGSPRHQFNSAAPQPDLSFIIAPKSPEGPS